MSKNKNTVKEVTNIHNAPPPGEIDTLRDLIFGNQARETAQRLSDLETRLNDSTQELHTVINSNHKVVLSSSNDQSDTVRKNLTQRISNQHEELSSQINQVQQDLTAQLGQLQTDLSEQISKMGRTHQDRLQAASEEARERDDGLRQELLTLTAWLDEKKMSRHQLSDFLTEMGQKILNGDAKPAADKQSD